MKPSVIVFPAAELASRSRLFAALAHWLEIDFIDESRRNGKEISAEIYFISSSDDALLSGVGSSRQRLIFVENVAAEKREAEITFSSSHTIHMALRGQTLSEKSAVTLPAAVKGEVFASAKEGAVWICNEERNRKLEYLSNVPDELPEGGYLCDQLKAGTCLSLLPLIDFLRRIERTDVWEEAPLRACFMFDDPNLHGTKYGYINFEALADHAEQHNYHVSMATVPLDVWGANSRAVKIFQSRASRLSFLIHGNDHTNRELAQNYTDRQRQQLVAQSLKRIARLEKILGMPVPRVMAAPHGACSEAMAGELLRQGYEAACISRGSLSFYNPGRQWNPSTGLEPVEFIAGGFPVIPRFRVSYGCLPQVILSAFLGQPIIPVGHHQDVARGLDLLKEVSFHIHCMGAVTWCNMSKISRMNFRKRKEGSTLHIRMYARMIVLRIPEDVDTVSFEQMWMDGGRERIEPMEMRVADGDWARIDCVVINCSKAGLAGRTAEIRATAPNFLDYQNLSLPGFKPWPIIRRVLAETRDRVQATLCR